MNYKYRLHNFNRESNVDTLALSYMQGLMKTFDYIPWTGSSIRPSALCTIINDIIINGRKNIIEFGSGVSTLFIARLIQANGLKIKFTSIEEDKDWFNFMQSQLVKYELDDYVDCIFAPIVNNSKGDAWHELTFLNKLQNIDCIVVDGPKAFSRETSSIRKTAVYELKELLSDRFSIFLDDCHRDSEMKISKEWSLELGVKVFHYYQHLGVLFGGQFFNVAI